MSTPRRIGVVGHAQHVTLTRVAALPAPGDILHVEAPIAIPGGGGAITLLQLARGPAEVHFFTAIADDAAGDEVRAGLRPSGAVVHAARRAAPHSRDLVFITPDGERTIIVMQPPLQPRFGDGLPWDLLGTCDAVYFTGQDPEILRAARAARVLVVTARRAGVLAAAGVAADVVVGSANDPREASRLADYALPPRALVMTAGGAPGRIETADGVASFPAAPPPATITGSYGAGDSFVGALTWFLAAGLALVEACTRAARYGAAVLAGVNPLEHQLPLA